MQGEVKDAIFTDLNNKRLEESDKYRELFVVGTNLSERTDRVFSYVPARQLSGRTSASGIDVNGIHKDLIPALRKLKVRLINFIPF